eukprot:4826023-Karenia_brevis.AAC.1
MQTSEGGCGHCRPSMASRCAHPPPIARICGERGLKKRASGGGCTVIWPIMASRCAHPGTDLRT